MGGSVRLNCGARLFPAELLDISLKGALISRPSQWTSSDQTCRLEFLLGDGAIAILMDGHIAHEEASRLGFRCEHIDLESISHLKRLVELNLGDTDLLERELEELSRGEG